jgi:hypothetical protein
LVLIGGVGLLTGTALAGMSITTWDLGTMVGGFGLVGAGTVILMDGLL